MKSALALCTHRELMGSIARTIRIRTDPLFDRLTGGLDDLYSSVDTVFEKAGIHELPCPGRKNLSLKGASNKFVAFLDSVAVPFDVKATAKAVWDSDRFADLCRRAVFTSRRLQCNHAPHREPG
jgi:hypothetical protein